MKVNKSDDPAVTLFMPELRIQRRGEGKRRGGEERKEEKWALETTNRNGEDR